jgi:hypothetical protein
LEVVSNDVNTIVQVRVMGQDFAPTGEPRDRTDHQQTVAFAKLGASSLDHERFAVRRRNHFGVLVELFAHCFKPVTPLGIGTSASPAGRCNTK